jgi:serine-threonine kinase receptor-associated protein
MLRDGVTGDWIGTFEGHKGAIWSAKLNSTATIVATGSADFSAKIWDAATGAEKHTYPHPHVVKTVAFSPDDKILVTGGQDNKIRTFDAEHATEALLTIPQDAKVLKCLYASQDILFTGTADGIVKKWDPRSNECVWQEEMFTGKQMMNMDIELSRDHKFLTVASDRFVKIFDASALKLLKNHKMEISFSEEGGASVHPDGTKFAAGGSDLGVRVCSFETGEVLELMKGHHGPVRAVRYSHDGKRIVTGSEDGTIRLWSKIEQDATGAEEGGSSSEK